MLKIERLTQLSWEYARNQKVYSSNPYTSSILKEYYERSSVTLLRQFSLHIKFTV